MEENKYYEYDVKCRKCSKIERMCFGQVDNTKPEDFKRWVVEHSTFPIQKQCTCDNGMIMFHDIVSFGNVLNTI